jgi:hypothetical protein
MMELDEFHHQLQADVAARSNSDVGGEKGGGDDSSGGDRTREEAFTELMAEELSAAGVLESPTICYYEGGSRSAGFRVNGYSIPEEETRLDLLITIYRPESSVERINSAEIDRAFRQLLRFFKVAQFPKFAAKLEPGSEEYGMATSINELREKIDRVQFILLSNAVTAIRKENDRPEELEGFKFSYEVWDLERFRRLRASKGAHEPIDVDLTRFAADGIECVPAGDSTLGYDTCVAVFPGEVLFRLYDEYASRLLELNVRSYLQARGKINKGILETLIREPRRFLAYNNGITVVAESIRLADDRRHLLSIKGLQIVNGGQTTASIHRARKHHNVDISHVHVQAKLTVVPEGQFEVMVPEISRFSNTQNKVSEVDLGANNPYHVGIERVSRRVWAPGEKSMWFYERARGSYQTERARRGTTPAERRKFDQQFPAGQRFTKEDLARVANTWDGLPHLVSKGGQKNFVKFMEGVPRVPSGWEPPVDEFKRISGKVILFREMQQIARSLQISSFRINIVTYSTALLALRTARRIDLGKLWELQKLPVPLAEVAQDWMPRVQKLLIESVGPRNPTEWFKVEACWNALQEKTKDWPIPDRIRPVLSGDSGGVEVSISVGNSIARCMAIDAAGWFRIQVWGGTKGELKDWQISIAGTLASYAAMGWKRKPSEKQARQGTIILDLAQAAEIG